MFTYCTCPTASPFKPSVTPLLGGNEDFLRNELRYEGECPVLDFVDGDTPLERHVPLRSKRREAGDALDVFELLERLSDRRAVYRARPLDRLCIELDRAVALGGVGPE